MTLYLCASCANLQRVVLCRRRCRARQREHPNGNALVATTAAVIVSLAFAHACVRSEMRWSPCNVHSRAVQHSGSVRGRTKWWRGFEDDHAATCAHGCFVCDRTRSKWWKGSYRLLAAAMSCPGCRINRPFIVREDEKRHHHTKEGWLEETIIFGHQAFSAVARN
jgi:hypothetical protein